MKSRQAKKIIKMIYGTPCNAISLKWFARGVKWLDTSSQFQVCKAYNYYSKGVRKNKVKSYSLLN